MRLSELAPGDRARVESIEHSGLVSMRLADLGFAPGTPVEVLRRAPLGDPVVYALRGYQLCLRAREAALIWVEPGEPS